MTRPQRQPGVRRSALGFGHDVSDAVALRTELTYRYDMDDQSIPGVDHFGDWIATFGATIKLGEPLRRLPTGSADPGTEKPGRRPPNSRRPTAARSTMTRTA
jgi:hypothetical protein